MAHRYDNKTNYHSKADRANNCGNEVVIHTRHTLTFDPHHPMNFNVILVVYCYSVQDHVNTENKRGATSVDASLSSKRDLY